MSDLNKKLEELEEKVIYSLAGVIGIISAHRNKKIGGIMKDTEYSNLSTTFITLVQQLPEKKAEEYRRQFRVYNQEAIQIDKKYPATFKQKSEGGNIPMIDYSNNSKENNKSQIKIVKDPYSGKRRKNKVMLD